MRSKFIFFLILLTGPLTGIAARVDTLMVESPSMHKMIKNVVIIPERPVNQQQPLPTLYLLHGARGNYASWPKIAPTLTAYADLYRMIIVCPDGARTSWYFDSPVDSTMRYETYVAFELIAAIDEKYNTISNSSGRAISGLSMGGHGAFYLAFRHPDIWGAAGSMSGGLDIRPFPDKWDLAKRLGLYAEHPENWEQNTVINMIDLLKGTNLKLIFDIGVDDFFYAGNKAMHEKLLAANIPHDYIERPGGHTLAYWANAIKYHLLYFDDFFTSNSQALE